MFDYEINSKRELKDDLNGSISLQSSRFQDRRNKQSKLEISSPMAINESIHNFNLTPRIVEQSVLGQSGNITSPNNDIENNKYPVLKKNINKKSRRKF